MTDMEKQMLVFDLDNTLLPDIKNLPERTACAIRAAAGQGHYPVLATARPWGMTRWVYEALGLTTPVCLLNGARIIQPQAEGEPVVLADHTLRMEDGAEMLSRLAALDGMYDVVRIYGETLSALLPPRSSFMRLYAASTTYRQLDFTPHMQPAPVSRLMLYTKREDCWDAMKAILAEYGDRYQIRHIFKQKTDGTPVWRADVFPRAAGKWNAVLDIAARLGVARENIWCFGDEWNDEEMIASAAHGYALRDSTAATALAGRCSVTQFRCEDCGVADVLERELLA